MLTLLFIKSKVCTSLPDDGVMAFGKLSAHDIHESDELRLRLRRQEKQVKTLMPG